MKKEICIAIIVSYFGCINSFGAENSVKKVDIVYATILASTAIVLHNHSSDALKTSVDRSSKIYARKSGKLELGSIAAAVGAGVFISKYLIDVSVNDSEIRIKKTLKF